MNSTVDAKILSLIIAHRLAEILSSIIHLAQQGFIRGRSAVTNIKKVIMALEQAKLRPSEDLAIITLDAEKPFDNVQLPWLFMVLERLGLQGRIALFIQKMYHSPTARIISMGALSAPFILHKGTRQGCPLSPLFFNLALEPLSLYINTMSTLTGIRVGSEEIRSAIFADDILLFISRPHKDLPYVKNIFERFSKFSGLQ